MRKIENLTIDRIWIRQHDVCPNGVIGIDWSANIGFGQYVLVMGDDGKLHADSECMDRGENKEFIKALLNKMVDEIIVED